MEIRRYQSSDHAAVVELHVKGLQQAGAYLGAGPWDDDLDHIEEIYLENGGEFLVGLLDGRIIAMGALRRTGPTRAEIKRMRVHPDLQGRGLGKILLQELENRARALGYTLLHLDTSTVQTAAQHLYRKHGFQETGETQQMGEFTNILFEKRLSY